MAETEDLAPARATPRRPATNSRAHRPAARKDDDLEAQVRELQDDLHAITRSLAHMGEHRVDQVRSTAKAQASSLLHRGQDAVESVQDEFTQMEKHIKDIIRDRPLTAVAGALAIGFILAALTR